MAYATYAQLVDDGVYMNMADQIDPPGDGSPEAWERLLSQASADIDAWLRLPAGDAPGDRLDLDVLTDGERWALSRATILQAIYICELGPDTIVEGRPQIAGAGGVTFAREAPDLLAPMTIAALVGVARLHVWRTGLGTTDGPSA